MITITLPNSTSLTKFITLIGIDEATYGQVGDFSQYLQHPGNRESLQFALRGAGYDTRDHQGGAEAKHRPDMERAGWEHRRMRLEYEQYRRAQQAATESSAVDTASAATTSSQAAPASGGSQDIFQGMENDPNYALQPSFDPLRDTHAGIVLGIAIASFRDHEGVDRFLCLPGDDVKVTFPTAGTPPRTEDAWFTVVDFYESKMSEFDASYAFVPIRELQRLRGMIDPLTQAGAASAIQIRLKDERDEERVCEILRSAFPPEFYSVSTWREKQGPLLAAVHMETSILNILLFLIIAVAGFGILAIFFMIVIEKTRDIGVLKSLGASSGGVMSIFLSYGLCLGIVGSGVGMVLGLLFVANINGIADLIGRITGNEVFDPSIYYFYKIPTIVEPFTVAWIVIGAILIAVLASTLPARRAARLHPVEALRYE
jgi:lipoprotein-releasing system permease protein